MFTLMLVVILLSSTVQCDIHSYITKQNLECTLQQKHLCSLYFKKSIIVQVNILQVPEFRVQISKVADAILKLVQQFKVTSTVVTTNNFLTAQHTSTFEQSVTIINDNTSIKTTAYPRPYPDKRRRLKKFPLNTKEANIIITWNQTFLVNYLRRSSTFT